MASAIIPCVVCYENEGDFILCDKCNEATCLSCLENYKKIECPSCLAEYSDLIFKDYYNEYKELYVNYYLYKKVPYNDTSNQTIVNYFKDIELKKNIFWGEKLKIIGTSSFSCRKCFKIVNNHGICINCKNRICLECEEDYHDDKPCCPDALENIKNIRETCKKCPCCYAYIFKISGCPHMNCSYCGATFDWNNPNIIQKDKYAYKKLSNNFINNELHELYNQKYDKMYNKKHVEKQQKNTYLYHAPENTVKFIMNLKKELTKINKTVNKLTVDYFTYIKDEFNKNQGKELTQIDINFKIDQNFKNKFFISLKKDEYYNKIFKLIKDNNLNDVDNVNKILSLIHQNNIIPEQIKFFYDNNRSEFLNEKISNFEKKNKNEIFYNSHDNDETIKLLNKEQEIHAQQVQNTLTKFKFCLNTSHAGSGKTYTSIYIAGKLGIKRIILFCPKIMEHKWLDVIRTHNNIYKFKLIYFTYSEISSINFTTNNNIYQTTMIGSKLCINLNQNFKDKITNDTMIIFDEIHNIKTPSSKAFKFISALSEEGIKKQAYILSLSATPIERKEEIKQLTKKISMINKYESIPLTDDEYLSFYKKEKVNSNNFKTYSELVDNFIAENITPQINNNVDVSSIRNPFEYINKNIPKTWDKLTLNLNKPTFRRYKQELITVIKNCIDSGIDFKEFIKNNKPENRRNRKYVINQKIIDFIYSQNSISNYMTLYFRYISYIKNKDVVNIKISNSILLIYILCLYGAEPLDALLYNEYYETSKIVDNLKNAFFDLKIFNIADFLKIKKTIDLPNSRMLDIYLSLDDQSLLDSAFRQVLVEIDEEFSLTTLKTFALITKGLIISELVYVSYITNIIVNIIQKNIKIVIGIHYKETMNRFKNNFNDLCIDHLLIDGSVKDKQKIIDEFQNNDKYKLLITNIGCINTGVDLDDKIGNQPRVVFIIPNFKFSETIQFMYRFKRLNSKSEPFIFMLNNHMKIVNILLKKNQINQEIKTSLIDLESIYKITEDDILEILYEY